MSKSNDEIYPAMREEVTLTARVVGVHKHDVESHRSVTVQLSDGQGVVTNLKNIERAAPAGAASAEAPKPQEKPEDKSVPQTPERKDIPGPRPQRR